MRLICDAYGLRGCGGLLETILWWQDRCWRGIEARAAGGDLAMTRLRDSGAARSGPQKHASVVPATDHPPVGQDRHC
jgi:hypothetical protein